MHYYGGKHRTGKLIAEELERYRFGRGVVEPFCGALNVTIHLQGKVEAYDSNPHLIDLWNRCREEGVDYLPDTMSEEEYYAIRKSPAPEKGTLAFALLGCGFGGKWGHGYARCKVAERSYASGAKRGIAKKVAKLSGSVTIACADYASLAPVGKLIYCDPPYHGTPEGYLTRKFNHVAFWDKVREWSKDNTVLVSECNAPDDFVSVWAKPFTRGLRNGDGWTTTNKVIEKLFMLRHEAALENTEA